MQKYNDNDVIVMAVYIYTFSLVHIDFKRRWQSFHFIYFIYFMNKNVWIWKSAPHQVCVLLYLYFMCAVLLYECELYGGKRHFQSQHAWKDECIKIWDGKMNRNNFIIAIFHIKMKNRINVWNEWKWQWEKM